MTNFTNNLITGSAAITMLAGISTADVTGCFFHGQWQKGVEADNTMLTAYVVDLYLISDNTDDTLSLVHDVQINNSLGMVSYYQSQSAPGWEPDSNNIGSVTSASRYLDSFVSIGGRDNTTPSLDTNGTLIQMSDNGTHLNPGLAGTDNTGLPASGWHNSNLANTIGQAFINETLPGQLGENASIFLGRFTLTEEFTLSGSLSISWNSGPGTSSNLDSFDIQNAQSIPVPGLGGIAFLCGLGLARRRTR